MNRKSIPLNIIVYIEPELTSDEIPMITVVTETTFKAEYWTSGKIIIRGEELITETEFMLIRKF